MGWTSTKLGLMFLLMDTMQWRWWGSNPRTFGLESSSLPLNSLIENIVQPKIGDVILVVSPRIIKHVLEVHQLCFSLLIKQ